jgi:hypothetical protein
VVGLRLSEGDLPPEGTRVRVRCIGEVVTAELVGVIPGRSRGSARQMMPKLGLKGPAFGAAIPEVDVRSVEPIE